MKFFKLFLFFYKDIFFKLIFITILWILLKFNGFYLVCILSIILDWVYKFIYKKNIKYFYLNNAINVNVFYLISFLLNIILITILKKWI